MQTISVAEWLVQEKLRQRIAELERDRETSAERAARNADTQALIARLRTYEAEGYLKLKN